MRASFTVSAHGASFAFLFCFFFGRNKTQLKCEIYNENCDLMISGVQADEWHLHEHAKWGICQADQDDIQSIPIDQGKHATSGIGTTQSSFGLRVRHHWDMLHATFAASNVHGETHWAWTLLLLSGCRKWNEYVNWLIQQVNRMLYLFPPSLDTRWGSLDFELY